MNQYITVLYIVMKVFSNTVPYLLQFRHLQKISGEKYFAVSLGFTFNLQSTMHRLFQQQSIMERRNSNSWTANEDLQPCNRWKYSTNWLLRLLLFEVIALTILAYIIEFFCVILINSSSEQNKRCLAKSTFIPNILWWIFELRVIKNSHYFFN